MSSAATARRASPSLGSTNSPTRRSSRIAAAAVRASPRAPSATRPSRFFTSFDAARSPPITASDVRRAVWSVRHVSSPERRKGPTAFQTTVGTSSPPPPYTDDDDIGVTPTGLVRSKSMRQIPAGTLRSSAFGAASPPSGEDGRPKGLSDSGGTPTGLVRSRSMRRIPAGTFRRAPSTPSPL